MQGFRPHVTIQNKVQRSKSVYAALATGFAPFLGTGIGLLLWHYRGGPWQPAAAAPFGGQARLGGIE